ncbi:tubulin like protein [Longilinea arvoryzae]|uniref:Tubulin like protein n=1 Tax=Longilinea arvoryzae TaxID=360412 RepID=A0A0S7BH37_9CHLR|nr:tubulin-like doman-containing protein [Longilinea arvoryzae]GAP13179.1 tubulin like protein [Longilinea arvoryzae]
MPSTLIIGLGGTGAKTVIHIKKMLMDSRPDGKLPPDVKLLVIDTEKSPTTLTEVGPWMGEYASREQMDLKNIQIHPISEYYALIGPLYDFTPSHIAHWYDSAYFHAHPDARTILNVQTGAGMYRQVGRLALFNHLQNGVNSALYNQLAEIVNGFPAATCRVILTGSLAGGTGAALFIDIAHLVQVIAENNSKSADVVAALVLPEAFEHEEGVEVDASMRARSLAALRELDRFMSVHIPEIGFNMQYTNDPAHYSINKRTKGSPFSLVYLMEKTAPNNQGDIPHPLTAPIDKGIAPMMATWIAKLCDGTINAAYASAKTNINFLRNSEATSGLTTAFVSTFGTYSVVLPLAALVEDWSLRLAEEAVAVLAPAFDPENPILLPDTELPNAPGDTARMEGVGGCNLLRDATELGERHSEQTHSMLVEEIKVRSVKVFSGCFVDEHTTSEETAVLESMNETITYYKKNNMGLLSNPYAGALCPPVLNKNQPVNIRAQQLHDSCETQYARLEGIWKQHLDAMANRQVQGFAEETIKDCENVLNGAGTDKPMDALHRRFGRLPWLIAYIHQRRVDLQSAISVLSDALKGLQATAEDYEHKGWKGGLMGQSDLKTQMVNDDRKQHDYLTIRQEWLVCKRKQVLIDSELKGLRRMLAYLDKLEGDQLEGQLTLYLNMLVGTNKLLQTIRATRKKIEKEREKASSALNQVREVVNEPAWEEEMYRHYCQPDPTMPLALHRILQALQWEAGNIMVNGAPVPRLKLHATGIEVNERNLVLSTDQLQIDQKDNPETLIQKNLTRLSELTRPHFKPAWKELSVVDPFIWRSLNRPGQDANSFGDALIDRCNVMLTPGAAQQANAPTNIYLLAPGTAMANPTSNTFLTTAFAHLLANVPGIQAAVSRVLSHGDCTTLTYFIMRDGIELRQIPAFTNAIIPYLNLDAFSQGSQISRATNHIFRAEKGATQYEIRNNPLLISRVAMLLEDETLLTDYLLAWAFKYLQRTAITNPAGVKVNTLNLVYTEQKNVLSEVRIVACTSLLSDQKAQIYEYYPVEYITAAEAYMLRDKDYNNNPMEPVRTRLHELIESALDDKVKELEPQWKQGIGTAAARAAAEGAMGDLRDEELKQEARKHMYRLLDADLAAWDLGHPIGLGGAPVENKSRDAEDEFIRVLRSRIQLYCK